MSNRYQLIAEKSEHTAREYWNKPLQIADKIKDLRPLNYFTQDQPWHILDTLRSKIISPDEFYAICSNA